MKNLVCLVVILSFASCFDFRTSQEDAIAQFENQVIIPVFQSIKVEGRNISYVATDQKEDTLIAFIHESTWIMECFY